MGIKGETGSSFTFAFEIRVTADAARRSERKATAEGTRSRPRLAH